MSVSIIGLSAWFEVRSGARGNGSIVAWEFHNYNSGPAGIRTPYQILNQIVCFHPAESPLRQGSYCALAATANHFARESHMDELARAVGMDPLAFRLKNLTDARLKAVFEAAARQFQWGNGNPAAGRGFGIAGGVEKGGYTATCAEMEVERPNRVRVRRLVTAFECGGVVNPDGVRNQVEGAVLQGSEARFSRRSVSRAGRSPTRTSRSTGSHTSLHASAGDCDPRPQGPASRRGGGDADRGRGAGDRQRDLCALAGPADVAGGTVAGAGGLPNGVRASVRSSRRP